MPGAWARHPQPRIPAPGCRLSMLQVGSYLGQSGQEAAICIVLTICTAPARLGAVVLTSAWLEDGPHDARDHSVWLWLSLMWRRHCSEACPWTSLSAKVRPKVAKSRATHAPCWLGSRKRSVRRAGRWLAGCEYAELRAFEEEGKHLQFYSGAAM